MPILKVWNGSAWIEATGASGDVVGPGSSTDNAVARFDSTTGKLVQNSGVLIDDSNNLTGVGSVNGSAAQSFLITDASGVISALTPGNNVLMISTSTGVPSVAIPAANSYWTNNASSLYISVPLGANTFAGRLLGNPTDLSAASARTILGIEGVLKTVDQTKTTDTTLANDDDLELALEASATYALRAIVFVSSHVTPDFKFKMVFPSGTLGFLAITWHQNQGGNNMLYFANDSAMGQTRQCTIFSSATTHFLQVNGQVITDSTAGDWDFQWAQNTSDANATTVKIKSSLQAIRLA